jgi:hypothetical protein
MLGILSQENAIVVDPDRHAGSSSKESTETTEEEREPHSETAVRRITTRVRKAPFGVAWCRPEISGFGQSCLRDGNQHREYRDA